MLLFAPGSSIVSAGKGGRDAARRSASCVNKFPLQQTNQMTIISECPHASVCSGRPSQISLPRDMTTLFLLSQTK